MDILKDYFKLQKEIFEYFGYVEDWCVFSLDDSTKCYWKINDYNVMFSENKKDVEEETGDHYENEVFHQRFLPRAVYRGEDFTMVVVDTHIDGNKFLQVFDNKMELK